MLWLLCSVLALVLSAHAIPTTIQQHPHHVSLQVNLEHRCSGALISPRLILSLASCVNDLDSDDLTIRAGAQTLKESGVLANVQQIIQHKRYQTNRKDFDIALIVLQRPLRLSTTIQPVDLPRALHPPKAGNLAMLTGFGIDEMEELTQQLSRVEMEIDIPSKCKNAYAEDLINITERMFCASRLIGKLCKGDPGSPLVANNILLGLSAYEKKCGSNKIPGIYTDISSMIKWIQEQRELL